MMPMLPERKRSMEFRIPLGSFLDALSDLSNITSGRSTNMTASMIKLRVDKKYLYMSAVNTEQALLLRLDDALISTPGEAIIRLASLRKPMMGFRQRSKIVNFRSNEKNCFIRHGTASITLPLWLDTTLISPPAQDKDAFYGNFDFPIVLLAHINDQVAPMASSMAHDTVLKSVHIFLSKDGHICAEATDRHKLSRFKYFEKIDCTAFNLCVPTKFFPLCLGQASDHESLKAEVYKNLLLLSEKDVQMRTVVMEGPYIDATPVIDRITERLSQEFATTVNVKEFVSAMQTIQRIETGMARCFMEVSKSLMKLIIVDAEAGISTSMHQIIRCNSPESIDACFSPEDMLNIVKGMSCKNVLFTIGKEATDPIIITGDTNEPFVEQSIQCLMKVRP